MFSKPLPKPFYATFDSLERAHAYGVQLEGSQLIDAEGRHASLPIDSVLNSMAAELSVTHEALYRTITKLEPQGILRREDGELCIL